jgi:hypothetical protein
MPAPRFFLLAILGAALLSTTACGGGGGGGGDTGSKASPATLSLGEVTITGEVPVSSGTPEVMVDGVSATVSGRSWTVTLPYGDGSFTVDYRVAGAIVSREVVNLSRGN